MTSSPSTLPHSSNRGQHGQCLLVAGIDQLEEQYGPLAADRQIADLVDDHSRDESALAGDLLALDARVGRRSRTAPEVFTAGSHEESSRRLLRSAICPDHLRMLPQRAAFHNRGHPRLATGRAPPPTRRKSPVGSAPADAGRPVPSHVAVPAKSVPSFRSSSLTNSGRKRSSPARSGSAAPPCPSSAHGRAGRTAAGSPNAPRSARTPRCLPDGRDQIFEQVPARPQNARTRPPVRGRAPPRCRVSHSRRSSPGSTWRVPTADGTLRSPPTPDAL